MTAAPQKRAIETGEVQIRANSVSLSGELHLPERATGIVLFAHGSASSRHSPRNQYVARVIRDSGVGTLLFDLLTREEETIDNYTREFRFDINLLAGRLVAATKWLAGVNETAHLCPGYFGSSTGGSAVLVAAAELGAKAGPFLIQSRSVSNKTDEGADAALAIKSGDGVTTLLRFRSAILPEMVDAIAN